MDKLRLGLALTGSYCSFEKLAAVLPALCEEFDVLPIFSENAQKDSRFGTAESWMDLLEERTGHAPVTSIQAAEPLGPKNMGVTDTAVTMAAKGHLRNGKPLVIGVSTNDGLAASAENIGRLLVRKSVYFVPFGQDDPEKKPASLSCAYDRIVPAVYAAREGKQLQPVLLGTR